MDILQLIGSTLGIGFLSGIRLYFTVLALGLSIRFGVFHPSAAMSDLAVLGDPRVLVAAGVACLFEFFADKVPWVDTLWDAIHTVIRPLGAALLAATALGDMDPALKIVLCIVAGGVAFTGHSTKAAARLAANHSPEPFSNLGLSLAEDVSVAGGLWLVTAHPLAALGLLGVFLGIFLWIAPKVFRLLKVELIAVSALVESWLAGGSAQDALERRVPLPGEFREIVSPAKTGIRCVAGKRVTGLGNSVGYLCVLPTETVFVTRRMFRTRVFRMERGAMGRISQKSGVLMDTLCYEVNGKTVEFDVFKSPVVTQRTTRMVAVTEEV